MDRWPAGQARKRQRVSMVPILVALWCGLLLSLPAPALADSLQLVLYGGVAESEAAVLEDDVLAGIRGRGAESADPTAPDTQLSIILWDEGRAGRRSQGGSGVSQSIGHGHNQTNSLVTRSQRY